MWLIVLLIPLGFYGYGVVREWLAEHRLVQAVAVANAADPGWRMETLREQYDRQPANERLLAALNAFPFTPTYLGWYGDDISTRAGALPFDLSAKPNGRMPDRYLKILRDRLNHPSVRPLRTAFGQFVERPEGRHPELAQAILNRSRSIDRLHYLQRYTSDEFLLSVHERSYDRAIDHLQGQLALSRPLAELPWHVIRLISLRSLGAGAESTQTLLAQGTLNDQQLDRLQRLLTSHSQVDPVSLLRLLRAEAHDELQRLRTDPAHRDDFYRRIYSVAVPADASWFEKLRARLTPWVRRWFVGSLTDVHAEALERLNEALAVARRDPDHQFLTEPWLETWNKSGVPLAGYAKMLYAQTTTRVRLEAACAAVACERFRLAKGRWPNSLEELVPTYLTRVPTDPYSGQTVRFRNLPDGVVIYSVWLNRRDDGGHVLDDGPPDRDRGIRLYNPDQRGLKYEAVYGRAED